MENFLKYFYQDFGCLLRSLLDIFVAFFDFLNYLLNFPMRVEILEEYDSNFGTLDWILLIVAYLFLILLIALLIWGLYKLGRRIFRFKVSAKEYEALSKQVKNLQRDLLRVITKRTVC